MPVLLERPRVARCGLQYRRRTHKPTISAGGPITQVQKTSATVGAASVTGTYGSTPTNGNLLIAVLGTQGSTGTPTGGSGWNLIVHENGANVRCISIWWKAAGAGEPTAHQFDLTSGTVMHLGLYEYSGMNVSSPVDQFDKDGNGSNVTDSTVTTTAVTTTVADTLLIYGIFMNGTHGGASSWTNSFTEETETSRLAVASRIVSATGTYETDPTWVTPRQYGDAIVAFKKA